MDPERVKLCGLWFIRTTCRRCKERFLVRDTRNNRVISKTGGSVCETCEPNYRPPGAGSPYAGVPRSERTYNGGSRWKEDE